jgi:UDP-hydrolysing UDP-N-acetyl-D-glucosamine 2-epimerase
MNRRRVCVVVSARPSYSRVKTALLAMQAHAGLELQVVATASALLEHYGGVARMMAADGIPVAARAATVVDGRNPTTMATSTGLALLKMVTILENLEPDIVVTIADRYETLATATAAAYMNIPLAHLQGGEVTGSVDEKVRHAVTKLANLHLVSTPEAAQRVIGMGEAPSTVFVTGCPSIDLAAEVLRSSGGHSFLEPYGCTDLPPDYVVLLQHPVTTEFEGAHTQMLESLHAVRDCGLAAVILQPNEDAGSEAAARAIEMFRNGRQVDRFFYVDSMAPSDFLRLLNGSRCLVGNSSAGIRECSYMGVPVVNVGSRQRNRQRSTNVVDAPHERDAIAEALRRQIQRGRYPSDNLYGSGHAGETIASILAETALRIDKHFAD